MKPEKVLVAVIAALWLVVQSGMGWVLGDIRERVVRLENRVIMGVGQ